MPGLRVGYAIAPPDMVTRLRQYQDPWTVTAPAEAAALAALDDAEYRERSVDLIAEESRRLVDRLWEIPGLRPAWPDRVRPDSAPPLPNFVLVSLTQTDWDSIRLQEALATRGIFVRECSDFPGPRGRRLADRARPARRHPWPDPGGRPDARGERPAPGRAGRPPRFRAARPDRAWAEEAGPQW